MGNTPSAQSSPARGHASSHQNGERNAAGSSSQPSSAQSTITSSRAANLRLPMPSRPVHVSPQSSNPTSPSGRSSSPRRRKSLELPDMNKLSFTPAAPVAATATYTNHHLAPTTSASHVKRLSASSAVPPSASTSSSPAKWKSVLGARASPLAGNNALGAMSKVDSNISSPKTAPTYMPSSSVSPSKPNGSGANQYSPITSPSIPSQRREASPRRAAPIPIPGKGDTIPEESVPPPSSAVTTPPTEAEEPLDEPNDGLVSVPVQWMGGGKVVYVTGNFADNWKGRIKLKRSTHDFHTILRLAPGQYRLKFIVDESWRCSKQISTATDDDGTLVNWIEVEAPKTDPEKQQDWALDSKPDLGEADAESSQWTSVIPAPVYLYQYLEEMPQLFNREQFAKQFAGVTHLTHVPTPPSLPRVLEKVIVNNEAKKAGTSLGDSQLSWGDVPPPAGLDDNSILPVPNHTTLNHLTASAIKNGTLGVGNTTRYRKKYITTMFFKPTLSDLLGDPPTTTSMNPLPSPTPTSGAPPSLGVPIAEGRSPSPQTAAQ